MNSFNTDEDTKKVGVFTNRVTTSNYSRSFVSTAVFGHQWRLSTNLASPDSTRTRMYPFLSLLMTRSLPGIPLVGIYILWHVIIYVFRSWRYLHFNCSFWSSWQTSWWRYALIQTSLFHFLMFISYSIYNNFQDESTSLLPTWITLVPVLTLILWSTSMSTLLTSWWRSQTRPVLMLRWVHFCLHSFNVPGRHSYWIPRYCQASWDCPGFISEHWGVQGWLWI